MGVSLAARSLPIDAKCIRGENPESINHLFFHCDFARKVWDLAPFPAHFDARGWIDLNVSWNAERMSASFGHHNWKSCALDLVVSMESKE